MKINSIYLGPWLEALRPVRDKLTAPVVSIFRDERPEGEHTQAGNILTDYASDDPTLVANLLMDADPKAYLALFPIAERQATKTMPLFQAELQEQAHAAVSETDSEQIKDRLAERQARAAVALVRMGKADEVWHLLRHSADPRVRSFIINWLSPLGADHRNLVVELDRIDPNVKPRPPRGNRRWWPSCSTPKPRCGGR